MGALAREDLVVSYPDEPMEDALRRMFQKGVPWLPVVDPAKPRKVIGYVTREAALVAHGLHLENESVRSGLIHPGRFRPASNVPVSSKASVSKVASAPDHHST